MTLSREKKEREKEVKERKYQREREREKRGGKSVTPVTVVSHHRIHICYLRPTRMNYFTLLLFCFFLLSSPS